ncbi:MAG: DUF1566 domain-containing protein [Alphaproteobacteria bacterium]
MATILAALLAVSQATVARAKPTAAQSCEAAKVKAAGKAAQCRLNAAGVFAASAGGQVDVDKRDAAYAKCQSTLNDAYSKADVKYGNECPVPANTSIVDALTQAYAGNVIVVNQQSRFVDNGDGTVTDNLTHLMWEKKTGAVGTAVSCPDVATCPDPHVVNNIYTWSAVNVSPWPFDGTAATVFLGLINSQPACLAGHCDWRLPSVEELLTIVEQGSGPPAINATFGPTQPYYYWTATTFAGAFTPYYAWFVDFFGGNYQNNGFKLDGYFVRAVRSTP